MRKDSGQAVLEYILLLTLVVSLFGVIASSLGKFDIGGKLLGPLSGDFAHAYRYGHPKALGYDDGGPKKHPRANGGDNFRIFYVRPQ
jgi:hypothetical protein